jgi:hypothetical protein
MVDKFDQAQRNYDNAEPDNYYNTYCDLCDDDRVVPVASVWDREGNIVRWEQHTDEIDGPLVDCPKCSR